MTHKHWNMVGTYQYDIKYHLHGNRTHAFIKGHLFKRDLEVTVEGGAERIITLKKLLTHSKKLWWRSEKLEIGANPYLSMITSRNWILNEVNIYSVYWFKARHQP